MKTHIYTAEEARKRLVEGNQRYTGSKALSIDTSEETIKSNLQGQKPYAAIITCSDSRVIPEAIFSAGIGELFVVRVAGNVIDKVQLGSIEYAVEHLGVRLIVVLGHDRCGAVHSALHHESEGNIKCITDEILKAVGDERDESKACRLNTEHSCGVIKNSLQNPDLTVIGALYHLESGAVEFL